MHECLRMFEYMYVYIDYIHTTLPPVGLVDNRDSAMGSASLPLLTSPCSAISAAFSSSSCLLRCSSHRKFLLYLVAEKPERSAQGTCTCKIQSI